MAKQKKQGFFSWLGLGQTQQPAAQQDVSQQPEVQPATEQTKAIDLVTAVPAIPEIPAAEAAMEVQASSVPETAQDSESAQAVTENSECQPAMTVPVADTESLTAAVDNLPEKPARSGFFTRLKQGLLKTRENLGHGFISLFRGKKIGDELFEELEERLLVADVGVETTSEIIQHLTRTASGRQLQNADELYALLRQKMDHILRQVEAPLVIGEHKPFVVLMVGVNGVGKTTTIGKLARQFQQQGKSVMLAAGDTFRAAAEEQLQSWGERNHVAVVAQHNGADAASVIFDAIQAARARGIDVLIADTAGRLQNKARLMEELKKIVRVIKKFDASAPHEVMLALDASTGQNAVSQTRLFHEAVGVTGITLTKLDGTAKGGVIFSLANQFGIPLRYIGVGEGIDDLRPFVAGEFIKALFSEDTHDSL